ncbi:MAG: ATP-binding protein [Planctomyces sp.]|nr:ATP-binding protein [Planctomyces sp.]
MDYEKLGVFYLGRGYDLDAGAADGDLILYDSKDLTTHGVIVGMTGSGKTGLGVTLLEEAAIDGIPAIVIDPKGDLGNLLLTFPDLRPEDFQPWVDREEALRRGRTEEEFAADLAEAWRNGLAEWQQDAERIQRLRAAADFAIYTPGSEAGLPLSVLRSFAAPGEEVLCSGDALRERVSAAVSGLLALLGINADPLRSREHILLSNILDRAWRERRDLDLPALIREIQSPPFKTIGVMDLEAMFPASDRMQLAMTVNSVLAAPSFAAWTHGDPLDVRRLLYTSEGKPRIAVLSIAHLSENERMFFVTLLLNEIIAWMRAQPGTSSLRALVYMDEVFGYMPPTANPPTKLPLLTLIKQARAYGVGLVLATQNPVDLDYKALSNAGTWWLGRLQTERDKARVLDGLEGASSAAGQNFDRQRTERILSGLGKRVFLMNNVHEDQPVVFQTRWALSYLRGPMTRDQISGLMESRKPAPIEAPAFPTAAPETEPTPLGDLPDLAREAPVLPPEIRPAYVAVASTTPGDVELVYRPAVLGRGRLHYVDARSKTDCWRSFLLFREIDGQAPDNLWQDADSADPAELTLDRQPVPEARFAQLPVELMRPRTYSVWERTLKSHLYESARLSLLAAPSLKQFSRPGEAEGDFRARLAHLLHEQRDLEIEKLRGKHVARVRSLQDRLQRAQHRVQAEQAQASQAKVSVLASLGSTVFGAVFGRKIASSTNVGKAATSIRAAGRASQQQADVVRAEERVESVRDEIADLDRTLEAEVDRIRETLSPERLELQPLEIRARKSDISVEQVTLCWLPYTIQGAPAWVMSSMSDGR